MQVVIVTKKVKSMVSHIYQITTYSDKYKMDDWLVLREFIVHCTASSSAPMCRSCPEVTSDCAASSTSVNVSGRLPCINTQSKYLVIHCLEREFALITMKGFS